MKKAITVLLLLAVVFFGLSSCEGAFIDPALLDELGFGGGGGSGRAPTTKGSIELQLDLSELDSNLPAGDRSAIGSRAAGSSGGNRYAFLVGAVVGATERSSKVLLGFEGTGGSRNNPSITFGKFDNNGKITAKIWEVSMTDMDNDNLNLKGYSGSDKKVEIIAMITNKPTISWKDMDDLDKAMDTTGLSGLKDSWYVGVAWGTVDFSGGKGTGTLEVFEFNDWFSDWW